MSDTKLQELGRLILKGLPMITETKTAFLMRSQTGICGCLLGAAYVGMVGDAKVASAKYISASGELPEIIGLIKSIDEVDLWVLSGLHKDGVSATAIANDLIAGKTISEIAGNREEILSSRENWD